MNNNKLAYYIADLLNSDTNLSESQKELSLSIARKIVKKLSFFNYGEDDEWREMQERCQPDMDGGTCVIEAVSLDEAVEKFFKEDFAHDLWVVHPEVEIVNQDGSQTERRETFNIEHYEDWDY